jgi:hypothetical protein
MGLRRVENRLVPIKSFPDATAWFRLWRMRCGKRSQMARHYMLRIVELHYPSVWYSPQRAPAWRTPIGRQDRLPHYQHAQFLICVLR